MASYEELRSYARIIRNETKSSANTALRIGEMYLNIIDKMEDVDDRFNDFLTGTDTDTIINRWKELESFLNGYTETATLADLLSVKADKATTLAGYGITNAYTKVEVDGKITSVNTSFTTLQTTVSGHTTSINSLQNTVSGHTSSITSINSDITALQGYFTKGVANFASRLSDGAEYKVWGQTFFKDGKPVNVSGEGTFTQVNADSVLFGGKARLSYDSNLNALLLTRNDGTAVHFLASGALSTRGLGEIEEGGGGTGTGVDLLNVPSDIIPIVGGSYSLGSSAKAWKTIYASSGAIGSLGLYESGVISNGYIKSINNSWLINLDGSASFSSLTINGASAATRNWVNSQDFAKISDLSAYVNAEGGTINNATLTGDVTGNGWSIEGGIANFGEVNTDSLYVNGEGVLTSSSLANYVTLNSAQTISGRKTFTGGITASHLYSVEYIDSSELIINAEEVNFTYFGDDANILVGLINGYKPLTLGNTSFSPALTSGTVIGTITIGGESKTIFAPNGGSADLSNYVTLDGQQTITGSKYFSDLNANSIYLQGFELKPYSLDGSTPDRLMYDGGVLLDEYNYGEYLDSAYIKKSGGTITGKLGFTGSTYPHIYGNGNFLVLSASSDGLYGLTIDKQSAAIRARLDKTTQLGTSAIRWSNVHSVLGDFSGQITSSVADGTAPFVVASKSLVKNLNAEYVNGYIPTSGVVSNFLEGKRFTLTDETAQTWYIKITCGNWNSAEIDISVQTHYDGWNNGVVFTINGLDKLRYRTTFYNKFNILGYKLVHPSGGYTYLYLQVRGYYKDANNYAKAIIATSTKSSVFTAEKVTEADVSDITWDVLASNANYTDGQIISSVATGTAPFVVASKTEVANLHSATATKLHTAHTLWGQSFDGSGNVSGNLTEVGSITASNLLTLSSTNHDIYIKRGGADTAALYLGTANFRPFVAANGLLDLGSSNARWKGIYGQSLDLSGGATIRGKLYLYDEFVINAHDYVHNINGNADGELVIWPSEYLVIENDTITDYAITCSELVQTSDIRYKNILSNVYLKLSDIAAAPTFKFSWANDIDGSTHIGTSAQYWQEIAGELVVANKKTGKLGLDYSTAALVSAVSIAREVNTMKMWQTTTTDRIEELEDKVKKLEEENKELRELLNKK